MAKSLIRSSAEYNKHYKSMKGVDFSGADASHFAHLENMYRDYDRTGEGVTVSIPGFRILTSLGAPIKHLFTQRTSLGTFLIVHAGKHLYRFPIEGRDTLETLTPIATVGKQSKGGFAYEGDFYLLDGEELWHVSEEGEVRAVKEEENATTPYVPTVFVNGEEYEQRNLLSEHFIERLSSVSPESFTAGTAELAYEIDNEAERTCRLVGIGSAMESEIEVPSRVTILGREYRVTSVASHAFYGNTELRSIRLPYGITSIGAHAFAGCTHLESAILSNSVASIGDEAFYGCTALANFHFGYALTEVGEYIFSGCNSLLVVQTTYLDGQMPHAVLSLFDDMTIRCGKPFPAYRFELPVYSIARSIDRVLIDGESFAFTEKTVNGAVVSVIIEMDDRTFATGRVVHLYGTYLGIADEENGTVGGSDGIKETAKRIKECTVCELFDGRVFLSGNPKYPNTVFYSARDNTGKNNPTYFGILNYFNDGVGNFPVRALLSVGNSLAVFKEKDDGCGGIYYHTALDTGNDILPRIYPVSYIHSGVCALGDAISFYDDALFVGTNGITALEKQSVNLEKSIACRSHNVNARLLCEDLSRIRLCPWQGYLVVMAGGTFYLADSRQTFLDDCGSPEYEWYMLTGIGTYREDTRVYRYASSAPSDLLIHESIDRPTDCEVYSKPLEDGVVYYTVEGGKQYAVYPTAEFRGGIFHPASAVVSIDDLLFFGTTGGDICIFNNDLFGVAPEHIRAQDDFCEEEYKRLHGDELHPSFYNFDTHAPTYALVTSRDDCGIPHLTKDTVKHSLVIKCRALGTKRLLCAVCTDRGEYTELSHIPSTLSSFGDTDFAVFGFDCTENMSLPIYEKEKNWVEKEIALSSNEFSSPIGIHSISYRYKIKGKVKKY